MTTPELQQQMTLLTKRKNACEHRLMRLAPSLVDVLKDAGQTSTAARLSEILFEHEAIEQEMVEIAKSNPDQLMEVLTGWITGEER